MAPVGMLHIAALVATSAISFAAGQDGGENGFCVGECAGKWQQCGSELDGYKDCCDDDFSCYSVNKYYSQCRRPDSVATGWTGPFPCTKPDECDKSAVTFRYGSAQVEVIDPSEGSDTLPEGIDSSAMDEEICKNECLATESCVLFELRNGNMCNLYSPNILENSDLDGVRVRPYGFVGVDFNPTILAGVNCYIPPPACGPGALTLLPAGGSYFMAENAEFRSSTIEVNGDTTVIEACANLCAFGFTAEQVEGGDAGVCNGIAVEGGLCTLLFPADAPAVVPYDGATDQLFTISAC